MPLHMASAGVLALSAEEGGVVSHDAGNIGAKLTWAGTVEVNLIQGPHKAAPDGWATS